jgi:ABC-2 type transport system permease protein
MPAVIQGLSHVLPFRWMVSFPVETALGRLGPADVLAGYAAQLGWIVAAGILLRLVWRAGIRRYSAVGA